MFRKKAPPTDQQTNGHSAEINKDAMYGRYQRGEDADRRLFMKTAHKALDIPFDGMGDIRSTTNHTGIGWKEIVAVGTIGAGGLVGYQFLNQIPDKPDPPPVVQPADSDTQYDLGFWDKKREHPRPGAGGSF